MFGWFRPNPAKKLERKYAQQLEHARNLQRNGDIVGYSKATAEADATLDEIKRLEIQTHSQSNDSSTT